MGSSPVPVPRRRGRRCTLNDASLSCNRNDLRLNRKQSVSPETNDRSYSEWNIPSLTKDKEIFVKSKLDMSVSSLEDSMRSIKETETGLPKNFDSIPPVSSETHISRAKSSRMSP